MARRLGRYREAVQEAEDNASYDAKLSEWLGLPLLLKPVAALPPPPAPPPPPPPLPSTPLPRDIEGTAGDDADLVEDTDDEGINRLWRKAPMHVQLWETDEPPPPPLSPVAPLSPSWSEPDSPCFADEHSLYATVLSPEPIHMHVFMMAGVAATIRPSARRSLRSAFDAVAVLRTPPSSRAVHTPPSSPIRGGGHGRRRPASPRTPILSPPKLRRARPYHHDSDDETEEKAIPPPPLPVGEPSMPAELKEISLEEENPWDGFKELWVLSRGVVAAANAKRRRPEVVEDDRCTSHCSMCRKDWCRECRFRCVGCDEVIHISCADSKQVPVSKCGNCFISGLGEADAKAYYFSPAEKCTVCHEEPALKRPTPDLPPSPPPRPLSPEY